jgi:hypothetical protein
LIFSLDVRRARKGDCLLLHFGTTDKPGLVMIDGGPKSVYKPHLKPRLLEIKAARGLDNQQPLPVDMLMVSHVDDDHIQGLLDLTAEMRAVPQGQARMLRILRFWHNSFDEIVGKDPAELTAAFGAAQFGAAATTGELPGDATVDSDEDEEVVVGSLKVLASIDQGHRLRGDAQALGIQLPKKLVMANDVLKMGDMDFVVAGPMQPELKKLQDKHDKWVAEQKKKGTTGESALASYIDTSVANLSSIVVLAKSGGKTMLLTGDARGDKILKGLELVEVMEKGGEMHVDILKVPHHGSANNLDDDFFERVTADHYLFSGNGEHGNPERDAMEMLFKARGQKPFQVHITYPIEDIDIAREADWKKEQAKEKKKKAAGGKKKPRENWSAEKHALGAFFQKNKLADGQKINIVDDKKPHVIDLLDPLGH